MAVCLSGLSGRMCKYDNHKRYKTVLKMVYYTNNVFFAKISNLYYSVLSVKKELEHFATSSLIMLLGKSESPTASTLQLLENIFD